MLDLFYSKIKKTDWVIVFAMIPIFIAGLTTMSSFGNNDSYLYKQSIWIAVSVFVFFTASFSEYRFLKRSGVVSFLYVFFLSVLTLLFLLGHISKGAQSWFNFGGFAFQPVDLMKLTLIILLAKYFSRRHIEIANIRHIIVSGVYAIIPFVLVALQPDFGSAIIIFSIWFGMVLVSGISKKHLFLVISIVAVSFLLLWNFTFKQYQKARIMNFVYPLADIRGTGYNAYQSTIAVGSGGLFGKGIGFGTQSRLNYLPEYQTDFIFAAFAEEWGYVGVILLFIFYLLIFYRLIKFAYFGQSNFESLFTYGIIIWFFVHITINIGMNIGVMPVTGIPLPLMSYGGSHLLAECLALGMCMGMAGYRRTAHRSSMKNEFLGLE